MTIALPIPDPAPVTKARRPANRSRPAISAPYDLVPPAGGYSRVTRSGRFAKFL
jgi:hypothetical protein